MLHLFQTLHRIITDWMTGLELAHVLVIILLSSCVAAGPWGSQATGSGYNCYPYNPYSYSPVCSSPLLAAPLLLA